MNGVSPDTLPPTVLEHVAAEVAGQAARYVRSQMGSGLTTRTKSSPTDVVTETDLESERRIRRELTMRCPGSNIRGEEFQDQSGDNGIGWIVDPIDGTVNFLYDLPVVSVSIAATIDGVVVAGAVADVLRGETFTATRGGGARRNGQPIAAEASGDLGQALIGTGFAYDAATRSEQAEALTRLLPRCRDIRCMGSAALNLCWVACGRLTGYVERDLKTYDYAAGALIAREGGAAVELADDNRHDLTITAAPGIFQALRSVVTGQAG